MRLSDGAGHPQGHLTYCTNIHAGESLQALLASLREHVPAIRAGLGTDAPLGIGLRLGHEAAADLGHEDAFAALRSLLEEFALYVFTINGFPYGRFHGQPVKEGAYRPDWSEPERLTYTNALAHILARLLPEGMHGSISTVPGTFAPWADDARRQRIADHLVDHAASLVRLERETGARIALALEPEPGCLLETIDDTVRWFQAALHGAPAAARLAAATGLTEPQAAEALRRHLGVCYDVCHAAVAFEDARESLERLQRAGIGIFKLQLSAALRVPAFDATAARALARFDEPTYLHQVSVRRSDGSVRRWLDLPAALGAPAGETGGEWRVHFHVPIFHGHMAAFATTQDFLAEILAIHRQRPICDHLEVETYTWDVLPAEYRNTGLGAAIARELNWVRAQLAPAGSAREPAP